MLLLLSQSTLLFALWCIYLIGASNVSEAVSYGNGAPEATIRQQSLAHINLYHSDSRQAPPQTAGRRSGVRRVTTRHACPRHADLVHVSSFCGDGEALRSATHGGPPATNTQRPAARRIDRSAPLSERPVIRHDPVWEQSPMADEPLLPPSLACEAQGCNGHVTEGCYHQAECGTPSAYPQSQESINSFPSVLRSRIAASLPERSENYSTHALTSDGMLLTDPSFDQIQIGACEIPLVRPATVDAIIASRQSAPQHVERDNVSSSSRANFYQPAVRPRYDPFDAFTQRDMLLADRYDKYCMSWQNRNNHLRALREVNQQMGM